MTVFSNLEVRHESQSARLVHRSVMKDEIQWHVVGKLRYEPVYQSTLLILWFSTDFSNSVIVPEPFVITSLFFMTMHAFTSWQWSKNRLGSKNTRAFTVLQRVHMFYKGLAVFVKEVINSFAPKKSSVSVFLHAELLTRLFVSFQEHKRNHSVCRGKPKSNRRMLLRCSRAAANLK